MRFRARTHAETPFTRIKMHSKLSSNSRSERMASMQHFGFSQRPLIRQFFHKLVGVGGGGERGGAASRGGECLCSCQYCVEGVAAPGRKQCCLAVVRRSDGGIRILSFCCPTSRFCLSTSQIRWLHPWSSSWHCCTCCLPPPLALLSDS
jgi:hypothetical protein